MLFPKDMSAGNNKKTSDILFYENALEYLAIVGKL